MKKGTWLFRTLKAISLALAVGFITNAYASFFGSGGYRWTEEVLLHDGSTIVVNRSVEYGGRHAIGQRPPYKEQTITFTLPNTSDRITWKDEYSVDVGSANFNPMLVEVFGHTAYVLATPADCVSYNKWGRPNPPYAVFRYTDKKWKNIPLNQLPTEVKLPNIVISSPDIAAKNTRNSFLSIRDIQQENENIRQPEFRTIIRKPAVIEDNRCLVLIRIKGGWQTPGGF